MSSQLMTKWIAYRDSRRGTYEFRSQTRYKAVLDRLRAMGLSDGDTIHDVGAGSCQFGHYLDDCGWIGNYVPVDAVLDGTDLEHWECPKTDFVVCIEVLEHIKRPHRLLKSMTDAALYGVVLTTPNCEVVNVLECDPTHVSVVPPWYLETVGFKIERHGWFGLAFDSLLGWRRND